MNNSQLESTIKANQIAIESLKKEQSTIFSTIEKNRIKIEKKFSDLVYGFDKYAPFIPEKMRPSIVFHIASEIIRLKWNNYSREGYTNSLDIYYKSPKSYETKEGEYRWEFLHSSGRFYVCSNYEQYQKLDNEYMDFMKLSLGMYHFVNSNKEKIAAIHEEYRKNESSHYGITHAIDKLERAIMDCESQIKRNNIVVNFKPAGETAKWLFNKEIVFPTRTRWQFSRKNTCWFDSIKLVKENPRGVMCEFIVKNKDGDGNITSEYVRDRKTVTLDLLINMWNDSLKELERIKEREARKAEYEAKQKESQVNA